MPGIAIWLLVIIAGVGGFAFFNYQRILRRAKGIERGLKMVPLLIHLPPASYEQPNTGRDSRELFREKIAQAEVLYDLLAGTATQGFKSQFYGQRHLALEIVAKGGLVYFYAAVPVALVSAAQQAIVTAYPGAKIEEIEDYNLFSKEGKLAGTVGGELTLKNPSAYPIATFQQLDQDPMQAILNSLSTLGAEEGAGIQILLRPANPGWVKRSVELVKKRREQQHAGIKFSALDLVRAAVKVPEAPKDSPTLSNLELATLETIEEKTKHPGYEVLIRVVASAPAFSRAETILRDLATSFALYDAPGLNGFKFLPAQDIQGLVTAFIFRFFPPEFNNSILNSVELATLFHLPDGQATATAGVTRQASRQVDAPVAVSPVKDGLMLGYNVFRDQRKEVRLGPDDRRRHTYIVGQTGTGKSTMLENMVLQDMLQGRGLAFIDPHGDAAEKLIGMVPKERAEDIIYFNAGDTDNPLGLNLFEFSSPEQKDFLIQEAISMLYKLYDPGQTGIIGPRFEHWFRNAALTLMSDPGGSTFLEIPKVFTDTNFLRQKFKYVSDPTVVDFWTKEMAQTSDYHKSEMLGWFVSKFGAFTSNEIMRNILGQPKSAFNLREVMDQKKILIINLSKGKVGELNSQLLGMIFVIKFQAAAMSRADIADPSQRADFSLFVDEFQNFSTESFGTILSEARKYGLNLIVANQFIGQLTDQIREAVFGNIGTMISYRVGAEDAQILEKQLAPSFEQGDLINLPNYNAAVRMMLNGLPAQPFSLAALPQLGQPHAEMAAAIKQLSAAKFGRPKGQVEAEIIKRMTPDAPKPAAAPRPAQQPVAAASAHQDAPADTLSLKHLAASAPAKEQITPVVTPPAPKPAAPEPVPKPPEVPQKAQEPQSEAAVELSDAQQEVDQVLTSQHPEFGRTLDVQPGLAAEAQPKPAPPVVSVRPQVAPAAPKKKPTEALRPITQAVVTKQVTTPIAQPMPAPIKTQSQAPAPVEPTAPVKLAPETKSSLERVITPLKEQAPPPATPQAPPPVVGQTIMPQSPLPELVMPVPPEPVKEAVAVGAPQLKPGEIVVDEQGNVVQG